MDHGAPDAASSSQGSRVQRSVANLYPEATNSMEQAIAAVAQGVDDTGQAPEQAALAILYERMASLPPQLQMFMRGCPSALEAKRRHPPAEAFGIMSEQLAGERRRGGLKHQIWAIP